MALYAAMTDIARKSTHRKPRLKAASTSWTVRFAAAVPVLLAVAEAAKEQLPAVAGLMSGWSLVAASVGVSAAVAYLRVRSIEAAEADAGAGA